MRSCECKVYYFTPSIHRQEDQNVIPVFLLFFVAEIFIGNQVGMNAFGGVFSFPIFWNPLLPII